MVRVIVLRKILRPALRIVGVFPAAHPVLPWICFIIGLCLAVITPLVIFVCRHALISFLRRALLAVVLNCGSACTVSALCMLCRRFASTPACAARRGV